MLGGDGLWEPEVLMMMMMIILLLLACRREGLNTFYTIVSSEKRVEVRTSDVCECDLLGMTLGGILKFR